MKKLFALMLALAMLLNSAAMAESVFNTEALRRMEHTYTFTHPGTVNTVTRLENQPYIGQVEMPYEGGLMAYVDFITLPDYDVTLLRLMISIEAFEPISADEMQLTAGGKSYTFTVDYDQSEYDGLYMEDYTLCLTETSLPLLKAIAQQKRDDPIPVAFFSLGEKVFEGLAIIPGDDAAILYDAFIDLGGKMQTLKQFDVIWPCKVEKVK